VNVSSPVGETREGVGVDRPVSLGCRQDYAVGIGPVIVQPFPDAARAFRDVGLGGAFVMYFEVRVSAIAKKLRATWPEVGEAGDVLFGRQGSCLVETDRGHAWLLLKR